MLNPSLELKRAALILAIAGVLLGGVPRAALAQCLPDEVIKQVTITAPPNFTQADPFRTNRNQINIGFTHDGASGSYLVSTVGADVNGTTFLPLPTDTSGEVGAGFNVDGVKQVGVIILQQSCNVVVDSRQSPQSGGAIAFIQFDTKPPVITVQTVTLGAADQATPVPFTGQTFRTNQDQAVVVGTVVDPDNGTPGNEIQITVTNRATNQSQTVQPDENGRFEATIALSGIDDGDVRIEVTARDALDDAQATPNASEATVLNFVRDTQAPTVQLLEIIRFNDDPARRQVLSPGIRTFVGQETIFLRVTMSEQMASPPQVNVTQRGGVAVPAVIRQDQTINNTIFLFQYSVIPVEAQNGPATVAIAGQFDGNGPQPDFGFDRANNPIDPNDTSATVQNAFSVDTVAPDLIRLPTPPPPGQFVSTPRDGQVVGRLAFPRIIQVFVDDFNTSSDTDTAKDLASGVNFTTVTNAAPGSGSTTGLTISLRGPAGDIPGTPSVSPPTGLFLNLPDFTSADFDNRNFTDRDGDGVREPVDGTYTIQVGLLDNVGNTSVQTITFRVDTVPVSAESIRVNLAGCISLQTGEFPAVIVSSQDADFNVTATQVEFFSRIGGANSVPVKFDSDEPVRAAPTTPGTSATITLNSIRKPGQPVATDQFPNPVPPPPTDFVPPGTIDPRTGANDGLYFVRVTPRDLAGNSGTVFTTNGRLQDFIEFPVQLDNTDPFVERTFPLVDRAIAGPLNFLEAVIVDPAATNGNAGCGIDVNATNLVARIEAAYQPSRVDRSFIRDPNGAIPSQIRGTLKFTHIPNSTDPTRNDFNPKDDRFRVALEFTDNSGRSRTLPTDGSMDGIYSIVVNPTDRAGNSLGVDPVASPARIGNYFGLQPSNDSTINLAQFFFLVDNVPPKLELENFPDGVTLLGNPGRLAGSAGTGKSEAPGKTDSESRAATSSDVAQGPLIGARPFRIVGFASDLSAQQGQGTGSANSVHRGGAGMSRVEYILELVDGQGQPVPGVAPAEDPDKEGTIIPGKSNPIIPLSTAVLDPIQNPANSPIRSTTNSMDASFAGTLRERRRFVIDDILPPDDQILKPTDVQGVTDVFYRFTIRAIDRAGNVTASSRRVTIDVNDVKPPLLKQPANDTFTRSQVVQFRWGNVTGVRKFRFRLNFPTGSNPAFIEKIVQKTLAEDETKNVVQLQLSREGTYTWTVSSFDQVENEGTPAAPSTFTLDITQPAIDGNRATVTGDVQPTSRTGVLGIGTFNVRLTFTERLAAAPHVSWLPANPSTSPTPLETTGFTGNVWEGRGTIPATADPRLFDGRAVLIVSNVVDRAGNVINGQNQVTIDGFEVDTGPFFQPRFFINPLTPEEMTLVVLSSEELSETPRFSGLVGLTQLTNQSYRIGASPLAFFTTLKVAQPNQTQTLAATVSGTDLDGNTARRSIQFQLVRVSASSSSRLVSEDRAFAVEVPAGAVASDTGVYLLPPVRFDLPAPSGGAGPAKTVSLPSASAATSQGLVDIAPVHTLEPAGLGFARAARVSVVAPAAPGIPRERLGIYASEDGRWRFLGGSMESGHLVAPMSRLAPMRVMADLAPPAVADLEPADGEELDRARPTIAATIRDPGSGVDASCIELKIDGKPVDFSYDETSGRLEYTPREDLAPGKHDVALAVRDKSGNAAPAVELGLLAPDAFGFAFPVLAVPNPMRGFGGSFTADLTQPGATGRIAVELYDMGGRRIRTLVADGPFGGRRVQIPWDLTDDRGGVAANGVYLFRARATSVTGSKAQSRGKIALLR